MYVHHSGAWTKEVHLYELGSGEEQVLIEIVEIKGGGGI